MPKVPTGLRPKRTHDSAGSLAGVTLILALSAGGCGAAPTRKTVNTSWLRSHTVGRGRVLRVAYWRFPSDRLDGAVLDERPDRIVLTLRLNVRNATRPTQSAEDPSVACVSVRLRHAAAARRRVDGVLQRAPDRAPKGSELARLRDSTRRIDLSRGRCPRAPALRRT